MADVADTLLLRRITLKKARKSKENALSGFVCDAEMFVLETVSQRPDVNYSSPACAFDCSLSP